ncbi:MAG: helix-turn-helix domain-containing protein [Sandaracinus sp.]|nr:helix-turn-helix domain-containing protein [Sandaracinus sp.]
MIDTAELERLLRRIVREELDRAPSDPAPVEAPELLTLDEAAQHFRVHPRTVRRWLSDGVIPRARAGKRGAIRINVADALRALGRRAEGRE